MPVFTFHQVIYMIVFMLTMFYASIKWSSLYGVRKASWMKIKENKCSRKHLRKFTSRNGGLIFIFFFFYISSLFICFIVFNFGCMASKRQYWREIIPELQPQILFFHVQAVLIDSKKDSIRTVKLDLYPPIADLVFSPNDSIICIACARWFILSLVFRCWN